MPVDAGIFNALAAQPKSVQDYLSAYDQQDARKMALQQNALAVQQTQTTMADQARTRQESEGVRSLLAGHQGDFSTMPDALRRLGTQTAITQADALEKAILERMKTRSVVGKDDADAAKTRGATADALIERYRGHLPYVTTPQAAQQWIQSQYADPTLSPIMSQMGPVQDAVRSIPLDPAQLDNWKGSIDKKYGEMLLKQREFALKGNNELIGPNGTPNAPVIAAKKDIAHAGKSSVNIGVNTDKTLFGSVASKLGDDIVSASESARGAQGTLSTVGQIRSALASNKAITGTAANQRVALAQLGHTLGFGSPESPETLTKTRELMMSLGQLELEAAQGMKGQGQITENERALLKRAAAGDITFTVPELEQVARIAEKTAKARISRNSTNVDLLRQSPGASTLVPFLEANGAPAGGFKIPTAEDIAAEAKRRAAARGK